MTPGPRDYTTRTRERLCLLSGCRCYNPNCCKNLIAMDIKTISKRISHIEAASEQGPRFNLNMSDNDRRGFDNLVLLCPECHDIIDNIENLEAYPVELLKEWKANREQEISNQRIRNPTYLKTAINALSDIDFPEEINEKEKKPFEIGKKISYNSIKRNKSLIERYKAYYYILNNLYSELEEQGSFKKVKLLRNIENIYLKVKGKYVNGEGDEMKIIRENADNIFEDVQKKICETLKEEVVENIMFEIDLIMVDAFMRCKILEEPPKDDN